MFQTDLNHFFQSLESTAMNYVMMIVNGMGYSSFTIPLILVVIFGFDFKKGFITLQVLLWSSVLVDILKQTFMLPRPTDVDGTLKSFGDPPAIEPGINRAAQSFFEFLPADVINKTRRLGISSYGLPSGHVMTTTAIWGSLALLFRRLWLTLFSMVILLFMSMARMYYGRHFLADVLAGIVFSALLLGVLTFLLTRTRILSDFFAYALISMQINFKFLLLLIYLLLLPVAISLIPESDKEITGRWWGINIGFLFIAMSGFPQDKHSFRTRLLRVVVAAIFYLCINFLIGRAFESLGWEDKLGMEFLAQALIASLTFIGAVLALKKIRFY